MNRTFLSLFHFDAKIKKIRKGVDKVKEEEGGEEESEDEGEENITGVRNGKSFT